MNEDFEVDGLPVSAQAVFDSVRARLLLNPMCSGHENLSAVIRSASGSILIKFENLSKTRYCGTEVGLIRTDEQMLLAQQSVADLRTILLEARTVHSPEDYVRMSGPILLEIQQREQEILEYLSTSVERPVASH